MQEYLLNVEVGIYWELLWEQRALHQDAHELSLLGDLHLGYLHQRIEYNKF